MLGRSEQRSMREHLVSTTFPFHYMIQHLRDAARIPPILEVEQWIEVILIEDIGMIKDGSNPILAHRVHLPSSFGIKYFKGIFSSRSY